LFEVGIFEIKFELDEYFAFTIGEELHNLIKGCNEILNLI